MDVNSTDNLSNMDEEDFRPVKRVASPTDSQPATKLQRTASEASLPATQSPAAAAQPPRESVPPIFLDAVKNWPCHAVTMSQLTSGDFTATSNGSRYRIKTGTVANFRIIQKYLSEEKLPFFTFTLAKARPLKVVITGLPSDITPEELHDELTSRKFAVGELKKLRTRGLTRNIWVVDVLADSERDLATTRPAKDIYSLETLFYIKINIRAYEKPRGPPQCHRCQGYGHGSRNCGRPIKCVRCGLQHQASQCSKPAGERGSCCNCGEAHNANYRGCQAYKALVIKQAGQARPFDRAAAKPRGQPAQRAPLPRSRSPLAESAGQSGASESQGGESRPGESSLHDEQPAETDQEEREDTSYAAAARRRRRAPRNPANRPAARPAVSENQRHRPVSPSQSTRPAETSQPARSSSASGPRSTARPAPPPGFQRPRQHPAPGLQQPDAQPRVTGTDGLFKGHQLSAPSASGLHPNGLFQGHQTSALPQGDTSALLRQVIDQLAAVTALLQNLAALITSRNA